MKTRRFAANFTMSLGKIQTVGGLHGIRATKDKFVMCTEDYQPVHQVYMDAEGNIYQPSELIRGIAGPDDTILPAGDKEDIDNARVSLLPKNILELTAHKTEEVDQYIFPSENQGYFFDVLRDKKGKANPLHNKNYHLLYILASTPGVCLLGKCNLAGNEGLFRVGIFQRKLYIQKQLYPEALNEWEFEEVEYDAHLIDIAQQVAPKLIRTFEPKDYEDDIAKRLSNVVAGMPLNAGDYEMDLFEELISLGAE